MKVEFGTGQFWDISVLGQVGFGTGYKISVSERFEKVQNTSRTRLEWYLNECLTSRRQKSQIRISKITFL